MPLKIYRNKKTRHPSISIRQKDKTKWHNMPMSHSKPKHLSYIKINDPHPYAKTGNKTFVRKYIRKDKKGVRGFLYKDYRLSIEDELKIKSYLKQKYKKDDVKHEGIKPS